MQNFADCTKNRMGNTINNTAGILVCLEGQGSSIRTYGLNKKRAAQFIGAPSSSFEL